MNDFYFLTLCIFLLPFCLTDDFPLIACQVQCLFDHILYSLPSRPLYLGQISRLHVTFIETDWVSVTENQEQIFCTGNHLFLFVPTNKTVVHTRQWVKFCIYLLYNYCSVNSAKPPDELCWCDCITHTTQNTNTVYREDSAALVCWKPRSNLLSASPLQLLFIELLRHQCLWLPAGDGWHGARHQWLQVWEWD